MITVIKSPENIDDIHTPRNTVIFLAGSIEMGKAELWQDKFIEKLKFLEKDLGDIVVLNPRRDNWDNSWEQSIDNPLFAEQVRWEQKALKLADIQFFYFDSNTKSLITLMELGQSVEMINNVLYVTCPKGYCRKGNVDIVCHDNDVEVFEDINTSFDYLVKFLKIE